MSLDKLKGEAKRLRAHLSDAHGVKLKHASVLEAVAASHGARNWTALANSAKPRPGLARRLADALHPDTPQTLAASDVAYDIDPGHLKLGFRADGREFKLSHAALRRHAFFLGSTGSGMTPVIEDILAQQVAAGGGMLLLGGALSAAASQKLLQPICDEVGRNDLLLCVPSTFDPSSYERLDLKAAFLQDKCVFVDLPVFDGPPGAAAAVAESLALRLIGNAVELAERKSPADAPFLVVAPLLPGFNPERWTAVLGQARAFRVALVLYATSLEGLESTKPELMDAIVANTATKVFLRPADRVEQELIEARFGELGPDTRDAAAAIKSGLPTLETGEALVIHRGAVSRIKVRHITSS